MTLLASYEFTLRDGVTRGATLYTKIERQELQPEFPGSDIRCDLERVEVIVTTDARFKPKIFWSDEVFGIDGNVQLLMEKRDHVPLDIALIEVDKDHTWIMRSEPTIDDRIGITISSSKGKVLFTGIGGLNLMEYTPLQPELPPKEGDVLTFVFKEVYSWQGNPVRGCAHCEGALRKGKTIPQYETPDGGS